MNGSDIKNKKDFIIRFSESAGMASVKDACAEMLDQDICLFLDTRYKPLKDAKICASIKNRGPLKETKTFTCSCNKTCVLFPIIQGTTIYGYLLLLHVTQEPDQKIIKSIALFIDLALKEFQKSEELTKLYDTIRPRAIALSTIHTIHRLLSSTLHMDELIERIARLTLQVMRARCCSIMLLDSAKKYLVPKAIIDLDIARAVPHKKYRKIKIGTGIEGKVVKTGKTSLSRNYICVPLIEEDIVGVISSRTKDSEAGFNKFDIEILHTLAEQAVIAIKNAQMYEEQEKMAYGSIKTLSALLDTKSPNTYTHSDQFVRLVLAIADQVKLPREDIINLHYAALLPDTGRFSIPEEILKKPGGLSKQEYEIIKKQHMESLKILEHMEFLKPAMPIIRYHHERYDGTGYPEGLKGGKIPIGARIMAVADAFEAMLSSRPYKGKKISISQAIKEIKNNSSTQFDPAVVDAFLKVIKEGPYEKYKSDT